MLNRLGVLVYSPPLRAKIVAQEVLPSGHSWEVQLRGCSIWAVELIRREIIAKSLSNIDNVNAVLIDFFIYDLAKEKESQDQRMGKWDFSVDFVFVYYSLFPPASQGVLFLHECGGCCAEAFLHTAQTGVQILAFATASADWSIQVLPLSPTIELDQRPTKTSSPLPYNCAMFGDPVF